MMNAGLAIVALVALLVAWVAVQRWWVESVGAAADRDALDGRTGCNGCACIEPCEGSKRWAK